MLRNPSDDPGYGTAEGDVRWIPARPPLFITRHDNGDELWYSNQPYAADRRLHKWPAGHDVTLDDIDAVLKRGARCG